MIDFQSLYAAILGIVRDPQTGRFPEREDRHRYALQMAEYLRQSAISAALEMDLDPIVTNSDGSPARRAFLLGRLGAGASETVLDPGIEVVRERLSIHGVLSQQCGQAIDRWYGRI